MIYIFRRAASESARDLAEAINLNCRKIADLTRAHFGNGVRAGDTVVCWGEHLAPIPGVKILNGAAVANKLEDAMKLKRAGVPTVEVSTTQPALVPAEDPAIATWRAVMRDVPHPLDRPAITRVVEQMQQALRLPIPVVSVWLPRRVNHIGGTDLLHPPAQPDYYSKKEDIVEEYRVHCFNGKSIRAGIKAPRTGATQHPWIRSYDAGWSIKYTDFKSKKSMRELAAKAVEALGLQFGAVDIGKKADGTLIVLEVNRAPGLSDNSATVYAKAIEQWITETA